MKVNRIIIVILLCISFGLLACGSEESGNDRTGSDTANANGGGPLNPSTVTLQATLPLGDANCPYGGVQLDYGIDENSNGILDIPAEVDGSEYICNGEPGSNGSNGSDGLTALINITSLPVGDVNCPNGGYQVDSGLDLDSSGTLDSLNGNGDNEITATENICHGYPIDNLTTAWGNVKLINSSDHSDVSIELSGSVFNTLSEADGNYSIQNIPQGQYDVVLSPASGADYETLILPGYRFFSGVDEYIPDVRLNRGALITDFGRIQGTHYVSNDGSTVVYFDWNSYDMYAVPSAGGTPIFLAEDIQTNSIQIAADSSTVIFLGESNNLYSVPVTGGTPVLLASSIDSHVFLQVTSDSSTVVYRKSSDLYSVPIAGGTPVLLDSSIDFFKASPDSNTVVYRKSSSLYAVPISGGTPVLLTDIFVNSIQITSDSSTVVYCTATNLYKVPISGGTSTLLATAGITDLKITSDSSAVVYRTMYDLYSVPVTGGTPVLLSDSVNSNSFQGTPDSNTVVYLDTSANINAIPVGGGTPISLVENAGVQWLISQDSSLVFYVKNQDLYSIPISGGESNLIAERIITVSQGFNVVPNSDKVIYSYERNFHTAYYEYLTSRLMVFPSLP